MSDAPEPTEADEKPDVKVPEGPRTGERQAEINREDDPPA